MWGRGGDLLANIIICQDIHGKRVDRYFLREVCMFSEINQY
jgi:hypothetical protein